MPTLAVGDLLLTSPEAGHEAATAYTLMQDQKLSRKYYVPQKLSSPSVKPSCTWRIWFKNGCRVIRNFWRGRWNIAAINKTSKVMEAR
jgi:hypothetical protein